MLELDILLVIIVFAGLLGTLVPSLPGTGIILIAAILHALITEFSPLTWQVLLILAGLCFGGYAGQYLVTAATSRKMGASKYGISVPAWACSSVSSCRSPVASLQEPLSGLFSARFFSP